MKIAMVLRELHAKENELLGQLLCASQQHEADPEVHFGARDLAQWSRGHVAKLAEAAGRYGEELPAEPTGSKLSQDMRQQAAEVLGGSSEPGVALLADLRSLYLAASDVSLLWDMAGQGAQSAKDLDLLALTKECHPQTLRQQRWADALIKTVSPQVLAS